MLTKTHITQLALEAGAFKVGFARAVDVDVRAVTIYNYWLSEGNHSGMAYLERYPEIRRKPLLLLDRPADNGTIIVFAFSYYHSERQHPESLQIAMYAHGNDYHEVLRSRLRPIAEALQTEGFQARICVDSAPIRERYWAQQAGIGFIGRNNQLIIPNHGSYFFIAEIVTDAIFDPDPPCEQSCLNCNACIKACPGQALSSSDNNLVDCRRCLSYLTIEYRGESLPPSLRSPDGTSIEISQVIGQRLYGCDECQRVCPHNTNPIETPIAEFHLKPALKNLTPEKIENLSPTDFNAIFANSPIRRVKLTTLLRTLAAMQSQR